MLRNIKTVLFIGAILGFAIEADAAPAPEGLDCVETITWNADGTADVHWVCEVSE